MPDAVWVVRAANSTSSEILGCADTLEGALDVINQSMSISAVQISMPYKDTAIVSAAGTELYSDKTPEHCEWLLEKHSVFGS